MAGQAKEMRDEWEVNLVSAYCSIGSVAASAIKVNINIIMFVTQIDKFQFLCGV